MRRVVITGMGIYSCIGKNQDEVKDSLFQGRSGIGIDPARKEMGYFSALTGLVERPDLKKLLDRKKGHSLAEQGEYAYMATLEAFRQAQIDEEFLLDHEVGILYGNDSSAAPVIEAIDVIRAKKNTAMVGSGSIFQSMNSTITMNLSVIFHLKGINFTISGACASGSHAIGMASIHSAQLLNRQVFVKNRIKTMNESIYYNVDEIHNGISSNRKIRFLYFEYNVAKERAYRHGGAYYVVSPFAMTWDDENYYMVAFDSAAGIIKHYRVDKMEKITVLDEERDGQDAYEALDMAVYARKTFGMFTGEAVKVHLRFENHLVGAVLDRLGRDVILVPDGEDHFTVWTDVIVSPQFFAWLCGFQTAAKVIGPDDVVKQMAEHVKSIAEQYE